MVAGQVKGSGMVVNIGMASQNSLTIRQSKFNNSQKIILRFSNSSGIRFIRDPSRSGLVSLSTHRTWRE